MSEGLDMEIIHHPPKMRSVVNLIIAMKRMENSLFEFRDEELLSFMRESIIEGELSKKTKPNYAYVLQIVLRERKKKCCDGKSSWTVADCSLRVHRV